MNMFGVPKYTINNTPRSSPRGGLGFLGESRVALDIIQKKITSVQPTGALGMCKKSWKSFLWVETT
jgi:hypothetical protein